MSKARILFWFFLSLLPPTVDAQEANTGILYGPGHAYALSAPDGWVLDNESGVDQGLHAVFHPDGGSWDQSAAVMYTNVVALGGEGPASLEEVITEDIASARRSAEGIRVDPAASISTREQGRRATVYDFSHDAHGNRERVAYIGEPSVVVVIVLTARDKRSFRRSTSAFKALVESYVWISSDVRMDGGLNPPPAPGAR